MDYGDTHLNIHESNVLYAEYLMSICRRLLDPDSVPIEDIALRPGVHWPNRIRDEERLLVQMFLNKLPGICPGTDPNKEEIELNNLAVDLDEMFSRVSHDNAAI